MKFLRLGLDLGEGNGDVGPGPEERAIKARQAVLSLEVPNAWGVRRGTLWPVGPGVNVLAVSCQCGLSEGCCAGWSERVLPGRWGLDAWA